MGPISCSAEWWGWPCLCPSCACGPPLLFLGLSLLWAFAPPAPRPRLSLLLMALVEMSHHLPSFLFFCLYPAFKDGLILASLPP